MVGFRKTKQEPVRAPADAVDVYNENWLVNEIHYWEAAYDRITAQYLETKTALEGWKAAHENAAKAVHQWEDWYKSLEQDRDQYKQWDVEKNRRLGELGAAIEDVEKSKRASAQEFEATIENLENRLSELHSAHDRWAADNQKFTGQVQQWETWYNDLRKDRDLYKQWDADKKQLIERLTKDVEAAQQAARRWQEENAKITAQVMQWETWYNELRKERDLYKQWDAEKKQLIDRLTKELTSAWQEDNAKIVAQVRQWETWYTDLKKDRDRYVQWDAEKKQALEQLKSDLTASQVIARQLLDDNQKIAGQVKQWETWYSDLRQDRDRYRKWDQDKRVEIQSKNLEIKQLQQWLDTLYRNPFAYLKQFFRRMFRSGRN
jgi:chromosome segregation ATPase